MYYYKLNQNGEIEEYAYRSDDIKPLFAEDWQETEKEIKSYSNGKLVFADDFDNELEQSIIAEQQAEMQAQAEEEALKPTVEDLAEALDILTGIVLGGEE